METLLDGASGEYDLEPFWPSRQPHLFDEICCGGPGAPARDQV